MSKTELVGFVELQVGSLAVKIPIKKEGEESEPQGPLARFFEGEGNECAIMIHGDSQSNAMQAAVGEAAQKALTHLSRKLLN